MGAVVGHVVAGHGREHHIGEPERGNCLGHPHRLGRIERGRGLALLHLAEGAAAGADRASQQKGGGASGVALCSVGAAALLADGVQPLLLHQSLHVFQG